jgi:lactate 2-monooxygenase
MIPRMMRPTTERDTSIELFGHRYDSPILCAPIGVLGITHDDKETGVAEVAGELGVPYILSTAATSSIEDVAEASGDGPRFYQLYWPNDGTSILLYLCEIAVLVVTLLRCEKSYLRPG